MSLLAFERADQSAHAERRPRLSRSAGAGIAGCLLATWAVSLLVRTTHFEVSSIAQELSSYVLYVGLWGWLSWHNRPHRLRNTLVVLALWAATSVLVGRLTKSGLTAHFLETDAATQPRLYWGLLFWVPVVIMWIWSRRDVVLRVGGLSLRNWSWQLITALCTATVISVHFITSIHFSGVAKLSLKPAPYMAWMFGYEAYQSLAEELFFRGVVMRFLLVRYSLNLWQATALTTLLNLSLFLLRTNWHQPLLLIGLVVYLSLISGAACVLYWRFQSVVPGWLTNVAVSLVTVLRG